MENANERIFSNTNIQTKRHLIGIRPRLWSSISLNAAGLRSRSLYMKNTINVDFNVSRHSYTYTLLQPEHRSATLIFAVRLGPVTEIDLPQSLWIEI